MRHLAWLMGLTLICGAHSYDSLGEDAPSLFPETTDLLDDVPAHFPRFHWEAGDDSDQWLSRYLWYHFKTRSGGGKVLFNQEYLATADMWMADAMHPGWDKPVQALHRNNLLGIQIDPEGYVNTHQHFSHAHEQGWPFPLWTQGPTGPEGKTAGFHFEHDGQGWAWDTLRNLPDTRFARNKSIEGWTLDKVESLGIVDNNWKLKATGESPAITTPADVQIDAFVAPFLQLRWKRGNPPPTGVLPYVEWMRIEDAEFSPGRRMYFGFDSGNPDYEATTGMTHSMITMHRHPDWNGPIKSIRIVLAPGESDVEFEIDSFFTVYDTRHTINNPIYILASWEYFRWTRDVPFLREMANRMRIALRYQLTTMGGSEHKFIRNRWVGHDGLPGFTINEDGTKTIHHGRGIGSNYWDLLPFGWDDLYATNQYHASLLAMAEMEKAVRDHPEWNVPLGALATEPEDLRAHAAEVKSTANEKFWNSETGRFNAVVDQDGQTHDYGFTYLNLDAIWYGLASDAHAASIMEWLNGGRVVEGDTSSGADIYHWRFGPRATTKRNVEWYAFVWHGPESIPWGGQVQDGGAVLGFTFYDVMARIKILGPDNAWQRLQEILNWEKEVWEQGGYREYYKDGKRGTTLQGGGTAGGLGIDHEFYESSLLPAVMVQGFLGLQPGAVGLTIAPRLPEGVPSLGISGLLYAGCRMDIQASQDSITVLLKEPPRDAITLTFAEPYILGDALLSNTEFTLDRPGVYGFSK